MKLFEFQIFLIFLIQIYLINAQTVSQTSESSNGGIYSVESITQPNSESKQAEDVAPEDQSTINSISESSFQTIKNEISTPSQNGISESWTTEINENEKTEKFDFNQISTGSPESSTIEPFMPKPKQKSTESITESVTSFPSNSFSSIEITDSSHWTTRRMKELTISQQIDENSPGFNQLIHFLQDLSSRRDEKMRSEDKEAFFSQRTNLTISQSQIANITNSQNYIKNILSKASPQVQQVYSDIISLSSTPDFYYIPKKQRFFMVNKLISELSSNYQNEMEEINNNVKEYCKAANVDIPPYTIGNICGNKLGNGAILTK